MEVLVKIAQFLLSITILVLVHELGHFLFCRLFKIRVEKFRIFFDYKRTLWSKKIGETDFGFGWIPLGGYVKIAGMIDESMDREQMKRPPQSWEFRSKPAWQRLLVMIAGVLFNLLFAWAIYSATLNVWGDRYLPNESVVDGVVCTELAQKIGFETGDKVLTIYGNEVERFSEINIAILMDAPGEVEVLRDGERKTIFVRSDEVGVALSEGQMLFSTPRVPFVIGQASPGSGAEKAGLTTGDTVRSVNGDTLAFFDEYAQVLKVYAGQEVLLGIERDGQILNKTVQVDSLGKLGVYAVSPYSLLETAMVHYSFVESIPQGFAKAKSTVTDYLKQLKLLASPEVKASESIGGFISIGRIFPGFWNWEMFWNLTAFLSILLAVMNILPIPALDGGHVMILLFEVITRRKPPQRVLEVVQMIGIVLILSLVVMANVNDVIGLFSGK